MRLIQGGCGLLITVLCHATMFQGRPRAQLGQRPIQGRGLWEYMYYGMTRTAHNGGDDGVGSSSSIGVYGYDPIQGALSPMLRLLCHVSVLLLLWGVSLYAYSHYLQYYIIMSSVASRHTATTTHVVVMIGAMVGSLYGVICYIVHFVLPGVSVPSGPRPHKIQRIPQWTDRYWNIHSHHHKKDHDNDNTTDDTKKSKPLSSYRHRYVHGMESHDLTQEQHHQVMTGEPAGRDMWTTIPTATTTTTTSSSDQKQLYDDVMIQSLASGGRPYTGFNPNINPNRYERYIPCIKHNDDSLCFFGVMECCCRITLTHTVLSTISCVSTYISTCTKCRSRPS